MAGWVDERAHREIDGLLRAVGDAHVVGMRQMRIRIMRCDRFTQFGVADVGRIPAAVFCRPRRRPFEKVDAGQQRWLADAEVDRRRTPPGMKFADQGPAHRRDRRIHTGDSVLADCRFEGRFAVGRGRAFADDQRARHPVIARGIRFGHRAGNNDGARRDAALHDGLPTIAHVDDRRAGGQHDARTQHRFTTHDDAFDDDAARTDEGTVFDNDRLRLRRFEDASDADSSRKVHVLADLRAGADRRPRVDHRSVVDVRADVDVTRHQDRSAPEERTVTRYPGRHAACA